MWAPHPDPDLHKYIQTASAPPSPEALGPSHTEQRSRGSALGTGTESPHWAGKGAGGTGPPS